MAGTGDAQGGSDKSKRRAAQQMIAEYHQMQLRALLEYVRHGFARFDAGEIDEFELDAVIHHYKRSAAKLWTFCGSSGSSTLQAASTLSYLLEQGSEPDWWEEGDPARRRSS